MRSGATFTRVDSKHSYTRICGTTIGASMFWGILRVLNLFHDPTEAVLSAAKGDSSTIDMSVSNIYGGDYSKQGLPGNLIASSFAKMKDLNSE